ncbi:MAG TPA: hypothetical protein VNB94_11965 [Mycobacteriales bacterium]|nr:hypothetical protein [Mycobacteriales bacterium]
MAETLFRRRRRWPVVAGVGALLVAAAATGVLIGTRGSDGDAALDTVQSLSASPEASPAGSAEAEPTPAPSGLPSEQPSEISPEPSPEVDPEPTAAATPREPSAATSSSRPVPRSPSPAASPRPTTSARPTPSPTPFRYPPPGISLQVSARRAGPARSEITLRIRDTDGSFNGGRIDFGDGTDEVFTQAAPRCSSPRSEPYRAAPSDEQLVLVHRYPQGGSFDVFVRVRTDRPCEGTPVEEATKAFRVTVDEPSPDPSPSPSQAL